MQEFTNKDKGEDYQLKNMDVNKAQLETFLKMAS